MLETVTEFIDKDGVTRKAGDEVTFAHQLMTYGGQITHEIGEKAIVRSFSIIPGHWYKPLPDIWIPVKLSTVQLEGHLHSSFIADTFAEYKDINQD